MKNLFFSLFLPLRPFEIFFFFFQPSEPRRKEDFKQPQIQKKTEQVDSEGYNEIKEDSEASSEAERTEEEVSHEF